MKARKLCGLVLLFAMAGGAAFAGGVQETSAATAGPKKVELDMWFHDPNTVKWYEVEGPIYNQLHPELDFAVKVQNIPWPELVTKFITAAATGDPKLMPDAFGAITFEFPRLIKAKLLDRFVDVGAIIKDEMDNLINTDKWMYNGTIYGTDTSTTLCVYYYNKEIMDKAGVDPMTFRTYADFIAAGKKVKTATGAAMTVLDVAAWNQFQVLYVQNGGGPFDERGNVTLDSPQMIEALTLFKRLLDEGVAEPITAFYANEVFELYREGKAAGCIMADWYGPFQLELRLPEMSGKWRIAPLPAFRVGGSRTSQRGGTGYIMVKDSPEVQYTIDFYKHCYLTREAQLRYYQLTNSLPPYKPVLADPYILDKQWKYYGGQKAAQIYLDIFDEMPKYYRGEFLLEAYDLINTQILPGVVKGEATPEAALKKAAAELRKITGR